MLPLNNIHRPDRGEHAENISRRSASKEQAGVAGDPPVPSLRIDRPNSIFDTAEGNASLQDEHVDPELAREHNGLEAEARGTLAEGMLVTEGQTPNYESIYGDRLKEQPNPPINKLYDQIQRAANETEGLHGSASVWISMRIHEFGFGMRAAKKLGKLKSKYPKINFQSVGWAAKNLSERFGLPFGKDFSLVLEKGEKVQNQNEKAAALVHSMATMYSKLHSQDIQQQREVLDTLTGGNKREVAGYFRMFGIRKAGKAGDSIQVNNNSNYIVVTTSSGNMYQMEVLKNGNPLSPDQLKHNFDTLEREDKERAEAQKKTGNKGRSYAMLTAMTRRNLHKVTKQLTVDDKNRRLKDVMDGAMFTVALRDESPEGSDRAKLSQFGSGFTAERGPDGKERYSTTNNVVYGAGATIQVFKNGEVGVIANHALVDGEEFNAVIKKVNKDANEVEFAAASPQEPPKVNHMDWNIPDDVLNRATAEYASQYNKQSLRVMEVKGISEETFANKHQNACIKIALNLALADVRLQILKERATVKGEALDNKSEKKIKQLLQEAATFRTIEAISMTHCADGRVGCVDVSGQALKNYTEAMLSPDSNTKDSRKSKAESLISAIEGQRTKVKDGKEGRMYPSEIITLSAIEKLDNVENWGMPPEEASNAFFLLETGFIAASKTTFSDAMRRWMQADLLVSNIGSTEGVETFATAAPLGPDAFSVGIKPPQNGKPAVFTIRARGRYVPYAKAYEQAINKWMNVVAEQYNDTSIAAPAKNREKEARLNKAPRREIALGA